MLLLGALEGEGSLRGMWMRGKKHWQALIAALGVVGVPDPPGLTTVWYVLQRIDAERLEQALGVWAAEGEGLCMDGKYLRGSRRAGKRALQVLAIGGQRGGQVLIQREINRDEGATAVVLLGEILLEGKVVSVDAGLMEQKVVQEVGKRGGYYIGVLKGNGPEVKEAVEVWVGAEWERRGGCPLPDAVVWNQGDGRIGCREVYGRFGPRNWERTWRGNTIGRE